MTSPKLPKTPGRTTPSFGFSNIERAIKECLGARAFGQVEQREVIAFFGRNECVYCGAPEIQRWDHLIPVRDGGETVVGNIVPACGTCDDSKQHHPYRTFLLGNAPSSPRMRGVLDIEERLAKLDHYVAHHGYCVIPVEDRLSATEQARLAAVRAKLKEARMELEALIADHNCRMGRTAPTSHESDVAPGS